MPWMAGLRSFKLSWIRSLFRVVQWQATGMANVASLGFTRLKHCSSGWLIKLWSSGCQYCKVHMYINSQWSEIIIVSYWTFGGGGGRCGQCRGRHVPYCLLCLNAWQLNLILWLNRDDPTSDRDTALSGQAKSSVVLMTCTNNSRNAILIFSLWSFPYGIKNVWALMCTQCNVHMGSGN